MANKQYWQTSTQEALEQYINCTSATTSATTRNYIYTTTLYPAFNKLTDKIQNHFNISENIITWEDLKQDLQIYIWYKLLNKIKPELIQAAQQFIYVGCYNYMYSNYILNKRLEIYSYDALDGEDEDENPITTTVEGYKEFNADYYVNQIDNRISILEEIDKKIQKNKTYTTNTMYLEHLRRYIIANNFETDGFDLYVQKEMNITPENYSLINSKLSIRTKTFKTIKIK